MSNSKETNRRKAAEASQLAYTRKLVTIVGLLTGLLLVVVIKRYLGGI
jgi:hypothetical protein